MKAKNSPAKNGTAPVAEPGRAHGPLDPLDPLREQLMAAAAAFAPDSQALSDLLIRFVGDVDRAMREPVEIFPVCHHSPSSALHMVRRLQDKPPRVIYLELCEDMQPLLADLKDCKLPVALQAFAAESDALPGEALPVSVVAPITEASAEYQAIAYTDTHPDTQLVLVDRAVDFVFQWDAQWRQKLSGVEDADTAGSTQNAEPEPASLHGTAIGLTIGSLMPTYDDFLQLLLQNSHTRHFAEWWDQYVESAIIGADYATYRQVMFLIGTLMRHLGTRAADIDEDCQRERYMWTRIKQHMHEHGIQPGEALYVCGAAHSASDVPEFGTLQSDHPLWEIPPRTATPWQYGLIPSSYVAIEYQFHHPAGTVALAEKTWQKSLRAENLQSFDIQKAPKASRKKIKAVAPVAQPAALASFLTRPPVYAAADHDQLLDWCAQIVSLARQNQYLASTADSIAIYETALLLARMRNREHPSPYDFQDAAITCLEKDRTPKKRTIAHLCRILLGGDRIGTVGYSSLSPLVQDLYRRLEPLGINLFGRNSQRALIDFKAQPELRIASDALWKLRYVLDDEVARPVVGERTLGHVAVQEAWDVRIGKHQREVIMLGYEGVTLEQILEQRMKARAFAEDATAALALRMAEDALIYMNSPRLVQELGLHAVLLLDQETGADQAPDLFNRARRLVQYYRTVPGGLPDWLQKLVKAGYGHYAALLPQAFGDHGTTPDQIAGMLGFIFTLESLALSQGCQRTQLFLGLQGTTQVQVPPDKIGLLWTAEWLLGLRSVTEMRGYFADVLKDSIRLTAMPLYLNGFVLALTFAPGIARFVVEILSQLFGAIPDQVLLPWLPVLVLQLRAHQTILQPLIKEASAIFPDSLAEFDTWQPQWLEMIPAQESAQHVKDSPLRAVLGAAREALQAAPDTALALANWLAGVNTTPASIN